MKKNRSIAAIFILSFIIFQCNHQAENTALYLELVEQSLAAEENTVVPSAMVVQPLAEPVPPKNKSIISITTIEPGNGSVNFPIAGDFVRVQFRNKLHCPDTYLDVSFRRMNAGGFGGGDFFAADRIECLDDYTIAVYPPVLKPDNFYELSVAGRSGDFMRTYGTELKKKRIYLSTGSEPYINQYKTFSQIGSNTDCLVQGAMSTAEFTGSWQPKPQQAAGEPAGQMFTYEPHQKILVHAVNNCQPGYYRFRILAWSYPDKMPGLDNFFLTVKNLRTGMYEGLWTVPARPMVSPDKFELAEKFVYLESGATDFEVEWMNESPAGLNSQTGIDIVDAYIDTTAFPDKVTIPAGEFRKPDQFCSLSGDWSWGFFNGNLNGLNPVYMKYFTGNILDFTSVESPQTGFCFSDLAPGTYNFQIRAISPVPVLSDTEVFKISVTTGRETVIMEVPARNEFQTGTVALNIPAGSVTVSFSLLNELPFSYRFVRLEKVE